MCKCLAVSEQVARTCLNTLATDKKPEGRGPCMPTAAACSCLHSRKMLLTRCICVRATRADACPPEALSMRFGECPVFLTMGAVNTRQAYIFQLDVRVPAKRVCEEEGYSFTELGEEEIDASTYNRQHRVEQVPEPDEATRRRSSTLSRAASRRRSSGGMRHALAQA